MTWGWVGSSTTGMLGAQSTYAVLHGPRARGTQHGRMKGGYGGHPFRYSSPQHQSGQGAPIVRRPEAGGTRFGRSDEIPRLLPRSYNIIAQQCADEILTGDHCQRNASCQLGVIHSLDPSKISDAVQKSADFRAGMTMHFNCVKADTKERFEDPP
jgi:hypothetical protein